MYTRESQFYTLNGKAFLDEGQQLFAKGGRVLTVGYFDSCSSVFFSNADDGARMATPSGSSVDTRRPARRCDGCCLDSRVGAVARRGRPRGWAAISGLYSCAVANSNSAVSPVEVIVPGPVQDPQLEARLGSQSVEDVFRLLLYIRCLQK